MLRFWCDFFFRLTLAHFQRLFLPTRQGRMDRNIAARSFEHLASVKSATQGLRQTPGSSVRPLTAPHAVQSEIFSMAAWQVINEAILVFFSLAFFIH